MKYKKDNSINKFLKKDENVLINSIKEQKWYKNFNNLTCSNMASNPIFVDDDTLSVLWEINRKNPTEDSLKLIIDFISYFFGSENVEEIDYYKILLKERFNKKYRPITSFKLKKLVDFISIKIKTKIVTFLKPSKKHFKNF